MATNELDDQLGKALRDLEVPYEPATWESLSQRLDALAAAGNNTGVDDAAREALRGLDAPFDAAHWQRMEARLDVAHRLVWRLRGAKLAEAILLVLLLLQWGVWYPGKTFDAPPALPPTPSLQLPGVPLDSRGAPIARQATPFRQPAGQVLSGYNIAAALNQLNSAQAAAPDALPVASPDAPYADATPTAVPTFVPDESYRTVLPAVVPPRIGALDFLTSLHPAELDHHPNYVMPATYRQPIKKSPSARRWYAGMFAGTDQNNIVSSGGDRRAASGARAGLALGRRSGRWGLETGIGYTRKQYEPKREIEIYDGNLTNGYYGSALTGVDADVISVPVQAHRRLIRVGKLAAFAYAGASAHISLQKDYHYRGVYLPGTSPSPTPQPPQQTPQNQIKGRGLAEKGGLSDNIYATADAGLRLEYPLGARYTAYAQAGVQQQIGGQAPGPKQPRINSVGWSLGVLAGL